MRSRNAKQTSKLDPLRPGIVVSVTTLPDREKRAMHVKDSISPILSTKVIAFRMPFHYDRAAKVEFDSAARGSIAAVRKPLQGGHRLFK